VPSTKLIPLVLSDAERASLEALSRKRTASRSLAERARVVPACADEGGVAPLNRVAARTGLSRESVRKRRVWFLERRLLSTDPEFIGKVRDVVGPYMSPPENAWSYAWTRSPRSRPCTGPPRAC